MAFGIAATLSGLAAFSPAQAQDQQQQRHVSIHPYLEVQEVVNADFGGGETLTYTGRGRRHQRVDPDPPGAGDGQLRLPAPVQRKKGQKGGDVHSGLAAARLEVVPNVLSLDAGAIATRTHGDVLRPVPALRTAGPSNVADVYSVYGGPTLSTHAGPLSVGASYHAGYVDVNDHSFQGAPAGTPRIDRYETSVVQQADARSAWIRTARRSAGRSAPAGSART